MRISRQRRTILYRRVRKHRRLLITIAIFAAIVVATFVTTLIRDEAPTVRVTGPEEMVFDWSEESCGRGDFPDSSARAFRDAQGQVQLIASHHVSHRKIGPDLDSVEHDCNVVMESHNDPDPAAFNDYEWLASVYTLDGSRVFALVHNEYRGNRHPDRCPSGDDSACWYNTITLAESTDGGTSYRHTDPPDHLVAALPYRYVPDAGPFGVFSPSSIVHNEEDGYLYALVRVRPYRDQQGGTCVMRTTDLADPGSWRAWDGTGFNISFVNPYIHESLDPNDHICQPVAGVEIGSMHQSLTYSTTLNRYLLVSVGTTSNSATGEARRGTYFSFSSDLIHWTPRSLIMEHEVFWDSECGNEAPLAYPAVLDPDSPSRNFETVDDDAYLYLVRFNYDSTCSPTQDRDLIRIPIEISH